MLRYARGQGYCGMEAITYCRMEAISYCGMEAITVDGTGEGRAVLRCKVQETELDRRSQWAVVAKGGQLSG